MRNGALVPNVVRESGFLLFKELSTHPAVENAILSALKQDFPHPIYIHLESEVAAEFPWESLCDPTTGEFFALSRACPVGRMVDSSAYEVERAVEPPIRITAILAAAGSRPCYGSSCYEWMALTNAMNMAQFKIALQIFVCDDNLKQDIKNSILPPNVTIQEVNSIPRQEDIQDLFNSIKGFGPNLLHFFCHGSTTPNPHLELASRADYAAGLSYGSVEIEARALWDAIGDDLKPHIWFVTLNCCQGAAPTADAHSLASELVEKGFPAVIGMRETVASIDAHSFCEAFYRSLLHKINTLLSSGRDAFKVEWSHLMYEPRAQLRNRHLNGRPLVKAEGETKEWTLPTIYIGKFGFKLRGCSTNDLLSDTEKQERQVQLDTLKEARVRYDHDITPFAIFQTLDRQVRALEDELYPQQVHKSIGKYLKVWVLRVIGGREK